MIYQVMAVLMGFIAGLIACPAIVVWVCTIAEKNND